MCSASVHDRLIVGIGAAQHLSGKKPEVNRHMFYKGVFLPEAVNVSLEVCTTLYIVAPQERLCAAIQAEMADIHDFARVDRE